MDRTFKTLKTYSTLFGTCDAVLSVENVPLRMPGMC